MKIRTNFVTNSSSYSSAEIKIDNPVLLEILKKYNEMGAFEGTHIGGSNIGVNAKEEKTEQLYMEYYDIDESELEEMLKGYDDEEVALFYYEPEQAEIFFAPRGVDDIIGCLLRAMTEDEGGLEFEYPESYPAYKAFKSELSERKKEINENYRDVIWIASNDGYGESEPEEGEQTKWEFEFHK